MNERDDERLTDYLEGRLDAEARALLEARLGGDAALARRLRLLRALRTSLSAAVPPAPAGLKADLRRLARARDAEAARPWWADLREALSGRSWAYGAGAAFAAAGVALVLRAHLPERPSVSPPPPTEIVEARSDAGAQTLQDLWSEDDGEDHDHL